MDVLACLCTVHLFGEAEQAIDETLLDKHEVGSQTWLANQTLCFLIFDVFTDLFTHVHDLWVLYVALQTFVDVGDKIFSHLTCRIHEQYVTSNLVAIEVTECVVDTIVLGVEGDGFYLVDALAFHYFAWLNTIVERRSRLILCLEVVACIFCLHHGGVMTQTVYQSLEENLLVDSPCWIVCQTIFLCILDSVTDVATDVTCLAEFFDSTVITTLECINKLSNGLHRRIVAELIHLHLCTVHQAQCIVHTVVLVSESNGLACVSVATRNHCHCSNEDNC